MPPRATPKPQRSATIGSVEKAVSLLKILGDGLPEAGVSELARRLNVHKSTASRLLATLERGGLVERDPRTDKYHLGFELVRLAGQVPRYADLIELVLPALEALAQKTGETINLALPDDGQVINIYQISSRHLVTETNWVGRRTPYHCVANGKALLAWRSDAEITRLLAGRLVHVGLNKPMVVTLSTAKSLGTMGGMLRSAQHDKPSGYFRRAVLERFTPNTITTRKALLDDLARARQRGYTTALEELEIGLNAIAAPIRDAQGEIIAAVSVSGPAYRVTLDRVPELGAQTIQAAERISRRLGWAGR